MLVLEDGSVYHGCGFGCKKTVVGEVVFTTSMVGYPESLTDPSYHGQILVITHPLVGNYGVASRGLAIRGVPEHFESDRIWVLGLVIYELTEPSHWSSVMSLDEWLRIEGVPGMYNVDTRAIVKRIRERGVMMGALCVYDPRDEDPDIDELINLIKRSPRYDNMKLAYDTATKDVVIYEGGRPVIGVIDCGVKYGIIRELIRRNCTVIRYPPLTRPERIANECDAVIVSNGPGNPAVLDEVIESVRSLIEYDIPMLGICLGHQLIALALWGRTFKLKYGHRGSNKPVKDVTRDRCYVTTQNHGYAVDLSSVERSGLRLWFINADDKTVEGLYHERKPVITVQFHPEASPGPYDTTWIFDKLLHMIERRNE